MIRKDIKANIHISYDEPIRIYHKVVADLVCKFTSEEDTVLDIGCGIGYTLSEIRTARPFQRLSAADIDSTLLDITAQKVKLENRFKVDSIDDLFKIESKFNAIVMSHVLEHTYRPYDVIKGIMGMLHNNGIAVLAVPNPVRLPVIIGNMFRKHYVNKGHLYAWDRSHWINFLEDILQLDVLCYSQDYFPIPLLHRYTLFHPFEILLAKAFPWFAFSNIAVVSNKL